MTSDFDARNEPCPCGKRPSGDPHGLAILSPEEEVAMLGHAGFANVSLFYAGLSIKGWIAYAE